MRFTKELETINAYYDETKIIKTKYLWLPITINGETRWLETAEIVYIVKKEYGAFTNMYYYYWSPIEFNNK